MEVEGSVLSNSEPVNSIYSSVIGLSLTDSVLKETDKNSESFTVHRSRAQASFDPTPAAAAAAPTETLYFNAEREGRKRNFRSGRSDLDVMWQRSQVPRRSLDDRDNGESEMHVQVVDLSVERGVSISDNATTALIPEIIDPGTKYQFDGVWK